MDYRYLVLTSSENTLRLQDFNGAPSILEMQPGESHSCSPIFPVQPSVATQTLYEAETFVGFFCVPQAFCVIGSLPPARQKDFWFSLGLPSLITFQRTLADLERVQSDLGDASRATVIWKISRDGIVEEVDRQLCTPTAVDLAEYKIWTDSCIDPDVRRSLWTVQCALIECASMAAQYCPSQLRQLKDLHEDLSHIRDELRFLYDPTIEPPKTINPTRSDVLRSDERIRRTWIHERVDHIMQAKSIIPYVVSQTYNSVFTRPQQRSLIDGHSLLGTGTAIQALSAYSRFVERVFEKRPVAKAIRRFYPRVEGVRIFKQIGQANVSEWHLEGAESLAEMVSEEESSPEKSSLVFYSTRLGFTETVYVETAPTQVLDSADSIRWSLMTLSHELMHSHVRGLLATLFCSDSRPLLTVDVFLSHYDSYIEYMETESPESPKLEKCLRFIIMNYCFQKDSFDSAGKSASTGGDVNTPVSVCQREDARDVVRDHFKLLDEILVHTLDAIYFYNGDLDFYIRLLWLSWETVPAVYEKVHHYILRTLAIIGAIEGTGGMSSRYSFAWERLDRLLTELQSENPKLAVLALARNQMKTTGMSGFRYSTYPCIYLASCANTFLCCHGIQHDLRGGDDPRISDDGSYELETGEFASEPIRNPVAFIADRLKQSIDGNESALSEEYRSAWLMLACSSASEQM